MGRTMRGGADSFDKGLQCHYCGNPRHDGSYKFCSKQCLFDASKNPHKMNASQGDISANGTMKIIHEVAAAHNIPVSVLRSKVRPKDYFAPRIEVYSRLHKERRLSLHQIGRLMGGRDHTTILNALNRPFRLRRRAIKTARYRQQFTEARTASP